MASQYRHHYIQEPTLPYISNASPIEKRPHYISGSNVLTTIRGYVQRRPGFTTYTADTLSQPIARIFSWRQWNGAYFVMLNAVGGGQSLVYKLKVGTDSTFQLIYTSATAMAFDFVVANNQVYFGNGTDMKKYNGTSVSAWGIAKPSSAPTAVSSAGSINATNGGYRWLIAFENASTTHIGQISDATSSTGNFLARNYTLSGVTTADTQVTHVHVYRTNDGGSQYFELPSSPVAYSAGWSLLDSYTDTQLKTSSSSNADQNDPPPASSGCIFFSGRVWTFSGDALYYSNFEEQINGIEEESFAAINIYNFGQAITGLAVVQRALLVFTSNNIYRIRGDTLDTFIREPFLGRRGTASMSNIAHGGTRVIAWLDTSGSIYITDGIGTQDIGMPIRSDLEMIDQSMSSCAFHSDGVHNWLIVQDSSQNKMWVYDMDNGIWMVPWSIGGTAVNSAETAVGTYSLLVGRGGKPLVLNTSIFQDLGVSYTASLITGLMDLGSGRGPGEIGNIEYAAVERNDVALSDMLYLLDEDPNLGTFVSMLSAPAFSLEEDPAMRTQGEDLIEKWYFCRTGTARRGALKLMWAAESTEFRLYAMDMVSKTLDEY